MLASTSNRLDRRRMRDEMRERLGDFHFDHFVTLATNDDPGVGSMRGLLRQWDARMNRYLVGRRWVERPDERLLWMAFPEKVEVNSHWHLLVQLDPETVVGPAAAPGPTRRQERALEFEARAERAWCEVYPRGTFDCQKVADGGAVWYATKALDDRL